MSLIIMRGYSGSGKSTLARQYVTDFPGTVIVSRDIIRQSLTGSDQKTVLPQADENYVTEVQTQMVREALRKGRTVIVDDTNLRLKFARRWADLAVQEGVEFGVWDVTTPLAECLTRNQDRAVKRQAAVPQHVITTQAQKFPMPWPKVTPSAQTATFKPYVPDPTKPTAFGFDLDGTLAHMDGRGPYDSHLYHTDKINETLRRIMWALDQRGVDLIVFTGRSEDHRDVVIEWLDAHSVPYDKLIMRPSGDNRNDAIVKSELFDQHVAPHYNFLAQFDDRDRVVAALRAKGITVYQVAPGNF